MSDNPSSVELKGGVPLSDAIRALRDELMRAGIDGQQDPLRFRAGPIELTLQMAVTMSGKASGGIKWWLVEANGEIGRQSVATQTIKLTLDPVSLDREGRPTQVFIDGAVDGKS